MILVPDSWGSPLLEENPCHVPAGSPRGGQFAPKGTCPVFIGPVARALFNKTGARIEPVEGPPKVSNAQWTVMTDAATGKMLAAYPLAIRLGVQGSPDHVLSVLRHEIGHYRIGHRGTLTNFVIGSEKFGDRYVAEYRAWAKAIEEAPTHRVDWNIVRAGLMSYLSSDPVLNKRITEQFYADRDQDPQWASRSASENILRMRRVAVKMRKATLDAHVFALKGLSGALRAKDRETRLQKRAA